MEDKTILTSEDIEAIKNAIEIALQDGTKIWENDKLNTVKGKIKEHYRGILGERCCYCCKNTHGEFKLVLDIEHILPKAHYTQFEFSPFNLSVACKRCNMNVKRDNLSFLFDAEKAHTSPETVENYKLIHPNFDAYFDHLCYETITKNDKKIVKYTVVDNSSKGSFTYSYFRLKELEIDTINMAQGVEASSEKFSELIPKQTIQEIEELLNRLKNS